MTKNRTRTPVYLDPGMHPGLEVKGLRVKPSLIHVLYLLGSDKNDYFLPDGTSDSARRLAHRHSVDLIPSWGCMVARGISLHMNPVSI